MEQLKRRTPQERADAIKARDKRLAPKQTVVTVSTETITQQSNNDRIPEAVWTALQKAGTTATIRLTELLVSDRFNAMRSGDQLALIRLAFEYAYGKPEAPAKRVIAQSTLSGDGDAVSAALERLAGIATLPEHTN